MTDSIKMKGLKAAAVHFTSIPTGETFLLYPVPSFLLPIFLITYVSLVWEETQHVQKFTWFSLLYYNISALLHTKKRHQRKCQWTGRFSRFVFWEATKQPEGQNGPEPIFCFQGSVLVLVRVQDQGVKSPCGSTAAA